MGIRKMCAVVTLFPAGVLAGCSGGSTPITPTTPVNTPALYTESNATTGNAVLAYARGSNGSLTAIGSYATGGNGAGLPTSGLPFPIGGATGAVRLSANGNFLYAVDAGSADIAAFTVATNGALTLVGRYATGGVSPASITLNAAGNFLYVLNSGSVPTGVNVPGNITGFSVNSDGSLTAVAGSTQPLSASGYVDPSEVLFSPDGSYLVVTEKATSMIDIYPVTNGVAGAPVSTPSTGAIPFGFAFTPTGTLVVANAESVTNTTAATVSSYTATAAGVLTVVSGRVANDQGASCWISLTSDGAYGYTSDAATGAISGYSIGTGGTLTLLTAGGATASQASTTGPIDNVVTPGNGFLYVLDSMAGSAPGAIAGFSIGTGGALTAISSGVTGLTPGTVGLAVR